MSNPFDTPPPAPPPPANAGAKAEAAIDTWVALQSALVPIIGQGGFAALYQRCLHLAGVEHPWLAAAVEDGGRATGFDPLMQALSQQPPEQAAAGQERMLRTFLDLLANLIGPSLVQRLLGSVVVVPPSGPSEQDPHP